MPREAKRTLFGHSQSLLAHTLMDTTTKQGQGSYPIEAVLDDGTRVTLLGEGILQVEPEVSPTTQLIISAGIHGNETAPIELCDQLLNSLLAGEFMARSRALVLFGNPAAMRNATRYVDQNLNRLFGLSHRRAGAIDCQESARATELEQQVTRFVVADLPLFHYDLHTALRDSRREKFALYPFIPVVRGDTRRSEGRTAGKKIPPAQERILLACGVTTVLHHHKPQHTFSAWTANAFGAESFTFELGKVHPFGANDLAGLADLEHTLKELLAGTMPEPPSGTALEQFRVVQEIIRTGDDFVLNIADDVANFTEYPKGTLIWHDRNSEYRVESSAEYIVFPNRRVPVGERVGLLLSPTEPG